MLTSKEFAKLIGLSQSTVSRALNGSGQVSEETRQYVQQKAEEFGFVLNSQARGLRNNKTGTVGILFPRYFESLCKNMMFTYLYDSILAELIKIDYDVMIIYDIGVSSRINVLERIIKSRKVDGFINLRPVLEEEEIQMFQRYQFPCVSIFQLKNETDKISRFCVDEWEVGHDAGTFFSKWNEYRPAYVSLPLTDVSSAKRYHGFLNGLKREEDLDMVITCDLSAESAYERTISQKNWLYSGRSAIFVYNDMLALGVSQAVLNLGLRIPEQVQIISTDDIPMAQWFPPKLSTLHVPVKEMVRDGCAALKKMLNGEDVPVTCKIYQAALICRDTTMISK